MTDQALQTEFAFTLPRGYVDDEGTLHTDGRMRLATAADEIEPLQNPRVQSNSSYLTIVLLSRVVTELGTLETVDESVIENLFVGDLEYLQAMYERVNNLGRNAVETACPDCATAFEVDVETGAHLAAGEEAVEFELVGSDAAGDVATADGGAATEGDADEEVSPEAGNSTE